MRECVRACVRVRVCLCMCVCGFVSLVYISFTKSGTDDTIGGSILGYKYTDPTPLPLPPPSVPKWTVPVHWTLTGTSTGDMRRAEPSKNCLSTSLAVRSVGKLQEREFTCMHLRVCERNNIFLNLLYVCTSIVKILFWQWDFGAKPVDNPGVHIRGKTGGKRITCIEEYVKGPHFFLTFCHRSARI